MKRLLVAFISAMALLVAPAAVAHASQPRTVRWVCEVPGEDEPVTFVTAAEAARHGIDTANRTAGETFANNFGESCTVQ
jgi:hypothetical protein